MTICEIDVQLVPPPQQPRSQAVLRGSHGLATSVSSNCYFRCESWKTNHISESEYDHTTSMFANTGVRITRRGKQHLGAALGISSEEYVGEKVKEWTEQIYDHHPISAPCSICCFYAWPGLAVGIPSSHCSGHQPDATPPRRCHSPTIPSRSDWLARLQSRGT